MQRVHSQVQHRHNITYQCRSTVHIPGVLVTMRTEIHAARDTREWSLLVIPDATFKTLFFFPYLKLKGFTHLNLMSRDRHPISPNHNHTARIIISWKNLVEFSVSSLACWGVKAKTKVITLANHNRQQTIQWTQKWTHQNSK